MKTILVVEDDPARLIALAMIMRSWGYAVIEANNYEEARLICLEHSGPIQVLLTDYALWANGDPLLVDRLLALSPEMQVLFMFSSPTNVLHRPLPCSCTFLPKPFGPADLANAAWALEAGRTKESQPVEAPLVMRAS